MEWLIIPAVWVACGLIAERIRQGKAADGRDWFAIGLLLGPIGLLMALGPEPSDAAQRPVCIHCGKVVARGRERFCNHCGEPFAA